MSSSSSAQGDAQAPLAEILKNAGSKAFRGGISGSIAQCANVASLMWLRTAMTHQYRHGGTLKNALSQLYNEGGVPRFYRGVTVAMVQSPMSRFGDAASNEGVLTLLTHIDRQNKMPTTLRTAFASAAAAGFRVFLMPLDFWKTAKQVHGSDAREVCRQKLVLHGPSVIFQGSLANMGATWMGHFPWFATFNILDRRLPPCRLKAPVQGFGASCVSDIVSNSLRVIKTTKQTSEIPLSYIGCIQQVVNADGWHGLMFRGLSARILCNGLQGMVFSVGIKKVMAQLEKATKDTMEDGR